MRSWQNQIGYIPQEINLIEVKNDLSALGKKLGVEINILD